MPAMSEESGWSAFCQEHFELVHKERGGAYCAFTPKPEEKRTCDFEGCDRPAVVEYFPPEMIRGE